MKVDGVGVVGEVDEVPDFGGVEERSLGDGHVPVSVVEQHGDGTLDCVVDFDEGEVAGLDGGRFGDFGDGTESCG